MRRGIKYRAWDKKSKKMRAVNCVVFHYENECFADPKGNRAPSVINLWGYDPIEDGGKHIILHREAKDVELLEFTGLKDKNGREIFEGDVVKTSQCLREDEGIFYVAYGDDIAGFGLHWDKWWRYWLDVSEVESLNIEIIGNIYENPEMVSV